MKALLIYLCFLGNTKNPVDPKYPVYEIPSELKKGMYAVIREQSDEYEIQSNTKARLKVRKVITILNNKAKDYATLFVGYDKDIQVDYINAVVYDSVGKIIKKLKNSEIIDRSAISGYSLYEDNRIKMADLSQVVYPYTVEFEYQLYKKVLYSIPGFTLYSDDEISSQVVSYTLIFPPTLRPRYQLYKIAEPIRTILVDKSEKLTWTFKNIIPTKFEKMSLPINKIVPNIAVAPAEFEFDGYKGNMSTWMEIGQWQNLLNQGRDILPPGTKTKVKELTDNLKTDREKAKALYEYMQSKTRYVSIQLGIGGFQPIDAQTVDQIGYGDCKALSNYMIALLKEAGVRGYYTWVYGGEGMNYISPDFPMDYFNHIIVAIPQKKDTIWLECTSQTIPFGFLGDFTANRYALLVTDDGGKLVKTPRYSAEQNMQISNLQVSLSTLGDATMIISKANSGLQSENHGLSNIASNRIEEQKKWLERAFDIPSYNVKTFQLSQLKNDIPTVRISATLEVRKYAAISGKRMFFIPNIINKYSSIPEKTEARKTSVLRKMAFIDIDTISFTIPEAFQPEYLPGSINHKSKFGEYEAHFRTDQNKLIYTRRLRMNDGEFAPELYSELLDFLKAINKADNTKVVFINKT